MSVFISYSSDDGELAQKLAAHLIKRRAHVWIDKWEIRVGDSLLDKIQSAITGATAILILLSKASVASEWCRKELNAALMRELEEKRVLVLPILIDDCAVPAFLKEKRYADFRTSFDQGLEEVLTALAPITNDSRSRMSLPLGETDWSMDWTQTTKGHLHLLLTVIEQRLGMRSSVLTTIEITANAAATKRYALYTSVGLGWVGRHVVVESIALAFKDKALHALTADTSPGTVEFGTADKRTGVGYKCRAMTRVVGEDDGNDVVVDVLGILEGIVRHMKNTTRPMTDRDRSALAMILATPFK